MLAAQCHKPTMTGVEIPLINMVMTWGWFIHISYWVLAHDLLHYDLRGPGFGSALGSGAAEGLPTLRLGPHQTPPKKHGLVGDLHLGLGGLDSFRKVKRLNPLP